MLLEGACRAYDGVLGKLEGVDGKGHLGLRVAEGGRVHGLVERVVVEGSLVIWVAGDHDAADRRHLWRGLCSPLGRLIRD